MLARSVERHRTTCSCGPDGHGARSIPSVALRARAAGAHPSVEAIVVEGATSYWGRPVRRRVGRARARRTRALRRVADRERAGAGVSLRRAGSGQHCRARLPSSRSTQEGAPHSRMCTCATPTVGVPRRQHPSDAPPRQFVRVGHMARALDSPPRSASRSQHLYWIPLGAGARWSYQRGGSDETVEQHCRIDGRGAICIHSCFLSLHCPTHACSSKWRQSSTIVASGTAVLSLRVRLDRGCCVVSALPVRRSPVARRDHP